MALLDNIGGVLNWTLGTILNETPTAAVQLAAKADAYLGTTSIVGRVTSLLVLSGGFFEVGQGSAVDIGNSVIRLNNGAILGNAGEVDITGSTNVNGTGGVPEIVNYEGGAIAQTANYFGTTNFIGVGLTNDGTIRVSGSTLKAPEFMNNGGTLEELAGGKINVDGFLDIVSGTVLTSGQDEIFGDVLNFGGIVLIGGAGATGILTIDGTNGTYLQRAGGSLQMAMGALKNNLDKQ
jgi:hypothetical protein